MKSLIITVVLASLLSFAASAQVSVQEKGTTYTNVTINDDRQSAKIKVKGKIAFNDDETDVQTLPPGGRISYEKDNTSLLVTSDKQGTLSYEIDGKTKSSFTPDERRLIADCIQFLIDSGVASQERAAKLYARGGFEAVFTEIPRFKNDYVKTTYMNYLSQQPTISTTDLIRLLHQADDMLSSDYYKSSFLQTIKAAQLENKDVTTAYIEVIGDVQSDYYRAAVTKRLLASPLSDSQYSKILDFIALIGSDYYKADLLFASLKSVEMTDRKFAELLRVSTSINSDYHKAQVLQNLLKHKAGAKNRYSLTITAMDGIKSDYHKGQLLSQLIDKNITDSSEWVSLLEYTQKISSDYEKSKILQQIARDMPNEAIVKESFLKAAKGVSSDYEYGKVMRAVETKI
ncbi:hypothetical protein [Olivibacter sitiensis]|uniref:hypothetical protein n=1 Tax=Olivibacter sitiensis TaxID=376470 RepID=UPI00041CBFD1|nr:hypothetical protein [Olivibacter sitiensis]